MLVLSAHPVLRTRSFREFVDGEQVPLPGQVVLPFSEMSNRVLNAALTACIDWVVERL